VSCSQCAGIQDQFDDSAARKKLRHYRRRGPDRTTRLLIEALRDALETSDVRDGVLLDVGGGIGAIHHALLDGRLSRAVHIDASTAQISAARDETTRQGHSAMVEFVSGDFVALAESLPAADVVTLDRVICCFDDMDALVSRSGQKAGRFYGAVYPRKVAWMRVGIAALNLFQRLRGAAFRVFLHDPDAIDRVLRAAGLVPRTERYTLGWQVVVYARPAGAPR
jgi:magnesium-protoporphyrin O-methyltransferase